MLTFKSRERLSKLTPNNQSYMVGFIDWAPNNKLKGDLTGYINTIFLIMEIAPDSDITELSEGEFKDYFFKNRLEKSNITFIDMFKKFLEYLKTIEKPISLELDAYKKLGKTVSTNEPKPLTIKDVMYIRNNVDDYKKLFTFEMAYLYGLKLDELTLCTKENYQIDRKMFVFKNGKGIRVNDHIHLMIMNDEKLLLPVARTGHSDRLAAIGEILPERDLKWLDIDKTRKIHFFPCRVCNLKYENTPENWVINIHETDANKTKWIVCRNCGTQNIEEKDYEQKGSL